MDDAGKILELEQKLAQALGTIEALVEANAALRKELYEYKTYGMTIKEKLK